MARPFFLFRLVLGCLVAGGLGHASAQEELVEAEFKQVTDSRSFRWNFLPEGTVSSVMPDGGDRGCLISAGGLVANGISISFPEPQMTSDGSEYVLLRDIGTMKITRRIRLDVREDVVRFLDVFENTGARDQDLKVMLTVAVAATARNFLTPEKVFPNATQANNQHSILAMPPAGGPSVVWLLGDPQGKGTPNLERKSPNQMVATYHLTLKRGEAVGIVHYVAQRKVATPAEGPATIKALFDRLVRNGQLRDPAIPAAFRELIVNFSLSGKSEAGAASVDAALRRALEGAGLERGKTDGVALDANAKVAGTVTGGDFSVETEFGQARIAFADVAGIAGGAGVQRPVRVFLRNGEVLAGAVSGAKFALTSDTGLAFDIDLAQIQMLALRAGPGDGKPPAGAVAFLTTYRGDSLALAADAAATFPLASPWGMNRVPLSEIASLTPVREPFPAHTLVLENRSRILVLPAGEELALTATRFGKVKLVPQSVREIQAVAKLPPAEAPPLSDAPHCETLGDYRITGLLDLPTLHLVSAKGTTEIAVPKIVKISGMSGEVADGEFRVTLADGQKLDGQIAESVLPFRSGKCVWQVPRAQLTELHSPPPEKPPEREKAAAVKPEEPRP